MADNNQPIPLPSSTPPATLQPEPGRGNEGVHAVRSRRQPLPTESKDALREVAETIVFVVVLVLLLKTFAAEAFVIPTGSMAETLWGYQKLVECPECGHVFPVNCASEVEPNDEGRTHEVAQCTCPNCFYHIDFRQEGERHPRWTPPSCNTGDRVLVAKFLYDSGLTDYKPFDVVVFKFPEGPQQKFVPMNYIKRLIGLPRQTIGVYYGDLYVANNLSYDDDPEDADLPLRRQMHKNAKRQLLEDGSPQFHILRKPPSAMMAQRRWVYDNDHPARDLMDEHFPPRWAPEKDPEGGLAPGADPTTVYSEKRLIAAKDPDAWKPDGAHGFQHASGTATEIAWLRYRNVLRPHTLDASGFPPAELIRDFMGYNSGTSDRQPQYWVGDLMLDGDVTVEKAEGELVVEMSRSVDRFQARWQLSTGMCTLVRIGPDGEQELASKPTKLKKPGSYHLRVANFDQRLTLWVDRDLPFGDGVAYELRRKDGNVEGPFVHEPVDKNDLEPVSIGARGSAVRLDHLEIWRDTFYTNTPGDEPSSALTMYVQPGNFLCMGDNSPQSSDSRSWAGRGGLVPERLMLGRALLIYWPYNRLGLIR